jgi:hypothetical protein
VWTRGLDSFVSKQGPLPESCGEMTGPSDFTKGEEFIEQLIAQLLKKGSARFTYSPAQFNYLCSAFSSVPLETAMADNHMWVRRVVSCFICERYSTTTAFLIAFACVDVWTWNEYPTTVLHSSARLGGGGGLLRHMQVGPAIIKSRLHCIFF